VAWQLGIVRLLGFELDPFSVLVPFLDLRHRRQPRRAEDERHHAGRRPRHHRLVAARYTFRRLFLAGLTALLADVVAFAVLMSIDIPVIKELALYRKHRRRRAGVHQPHPAAGLLSYVGVSPAAGTAQPARGRRRKARPRLRQFWIPRTVSPSGAGPGGAIACALVLAAGGLWVSRGLQTGDLDPGAPSCARIRATTRTTPTSPATTRCPAICSR
jgi:hypothetical protein